MTDLKKLYEAFSKKELLSQALTHKSWVNEHPGGRGSNERLEFLGDAILEFIVSRELFGQFPDKEEGYLTALRASLVNTQNLSEVAKNLKVGAELFLSKGEEDGGGRQNSSLLADTVEAIIGALFIDSGIDKTEEFIKENLFTEIPKKVAGSLKDPKSSLQEYVQSKSLPPPKYRVVAEAGPDHDKRFVVEIDVDKNIIGRGEGKSKSVAEQEAAKKALEQITKL